MELRFANGYVFIGGLIGLYLLFSLIFTYVVQQFPRKPVTDPPDWGRIIDTKIPAIDGGVLVFLGCFLVGSSRVDLQACKLEYSIVSPK